MPICILVFMFLITVSSAQAGEFTLLGGLNRNADTGDGTYSWQVDYTKELNSCLAVSLAYINEGHVPAHHRDGHAVSLWAHTDVLDRRLKLAAGVGTYFYYDTTVAQAGGDYSNSHGLGTVFSLAATWKTASPWHYQIRSNVIKGGNSFDTVSVLAGIGYDLEEKDTRGAGGRSTYSERVIGRDELTFLGGQTIVNSFKSEKSMAVSLEYRRTLMRYLDGTLAWIYEGDNRLLRRNGFATQLWLADSFMDGTAELGMGVGAYFSLDHYSGVSSLSRWKNRDISAIVTLTATYHIFQEWSLRASWHRIVTDYDRDADIIMGGIGFHF